MSDFSDVALAADGDYQAFERLFRRYVIRVYSLCRRLTGSPKRGEELTREVFVTAWHKLPEVRDGTTPGAWLHRLSIDIAVNGSQSDGESQVSIGQAGSPVEELNDVATIPDHAERRDLSQEIDGLPQELRTIFVLHDVERYEHEEIAEILGITVGRSKAHLRRARALLIETLAR
ncbi:MAG: RNA polymerase sigma factor [Gemmatimonadaceae bacterium]